MQLNGLHHVTAVTGQAGLNPVVQVIQDFGRYFGMAACEGLPALGSGLGG